MSSVRMGLWALSLGLMGCAPAPEHAGSGAERPDVVSLAPSITEIVFALDAGDRLAGRTNACDYPPAAERVPVIGAFGRPSVEAVLASGAVLVLDAALEDTAFRAEFQRRGLSAHLIECERLSDIPNAVREVGRLLNIPERGEALAAELEAGLLRLRGERDQIPEEERPLLFIELWPEPLMTVGRHSFVHDVVEWAGARNAAGTLDRDYFTVDPEWVVSRNPSVILCLHGTGEADIVRRSIRARPGWGGIEAIRNDRIIAGLDPSLLQRPGPRVLEGISVLRARLEEDTP